MNTNKSTNDKENFKYLLDKQYSWSAYADTKISIAFGIFSVIYAVFGFFLANFIFKYDLSNNNSKTIFVVFIILGIISITLFIISLLFYFNTLFPKLDGSQELNKKNLDEKKLSIVYFNDISKFANADDFSNYALTIDNAHLEKQILHEIYYNAKICSNKAKKIRLGLIFSGISILLNIICFILSLLI